MLEQIEAHEQISPPLLDSPSDALFSAVCREGTKKEPNYVERYAHPMILAGDDIVRLWFRLSKFPVMFASPKESNFRNFVKMLNDEYSILVRFDNIGMAMITDIVPGVEARFHISFWDSKLSGREQLIRELVVWVMQTLGVRRVATPIRADARAMKAFMERAGMYFEGALKNWVEKDNKLFDLYLYGITRPEVDTHWLEGRSWAKPRVRLLEVYETK